MKRADRFKGCLVGLAVGDAVGTTVEFKPPGTFPPVKDMTGGGPFRLGPGQWTDDTSMALCLAHSLIECNGFDAVDQMERYVKWWRHGYMSSTGSCFDIGGTTAQALARFQDTGNPYAGSTNPHSAGNGSLMRLAPVPMFYAKDPTKAIEMCGESSRMTHGAETCVDACRFFGGIIVKALNGEPKDSILQAPAPGTYCATIQDVAGGSYRAKHPPSIVGSGYVVESLEAALWAFHNSASFEEGCLLAVNLGNDADTTAAIYGQLAGAFYGIEDIPKEWRKKLTMVETIESLAVGLFRSNEATSQVAAS